MTKEKKIDNANNALVGGQRYCPRCAQDTTQISQFVSEEDTQNYFRGVISNELFTKEYRKEELQLVVKFVEINNKDNTRINLIIKTLLAEKTNEAALHVLRIRTLVQLSYLSIGDTVILENPIDLLKLKTPVDYLEAFDKLFNDRSNSLVTILQTIFVDFDKLLADLSSAVLSKDFWKDAGRS